MKYRHILAIVILSVLASSPSVAGKLYKWIDENGDIQYSDSLPPEQMQKSHNELSERGNTVTSHKRTKTKKEIEEEKRTKREKKEQQLAEQKKRARQAEKDRVLLDTYLTEEDIIRMRDNKVATLEGTIQLTSRNLNSLKKSLEILRKDVDFTKNDTPEQKQAKNRVQEAEEQIDVFESFIENRRRDQQSIRAKYDKDLLRFRQLKGKKN